MIKPRAIFARHNTLLALFAFLIGVLLAALLLEVAAYIAIEMGQAYAPQYIYRPPPFTEGEVRNLLAERDPLLGWPTRSWLEEHGGPQGARISPANDELMERPPCLSVYGDSFVFSYDVGSADAWPNILAERIGCPVLNFGVNGYGVDQAVLRFENQETDNAPATILAIYPLDIMRNMNQWRYLLGGGAMLFKPVLEPGPDATLRVVDIPVGTYEQYLAVAADPASILKKEAFLPGAQRVAPVRHGFPYSLELLAVLTNFVGGIQLDRISLDTPIRNWNMPTWYLNGDGLAPAWLARNRLIVEHFAGACRARARDCAVLMIPDHDALLESARTGENILRTIYAEFPPELPLLDPTVTLVRSAPGGDPCPLFESECAGHYNATGYRLLAEAVARLLSETKAFQFNHQ